MPLLFSSAEVAERTRSSLIQALMAWLLIAAGAVTLLAHTAPLGKPVGGDFSNIFAGAVCLVQGCSPYKFAPVQAVLVQHGYIQLQPGNWAALLPLYPPPTLALFTPLAGLSFHAAGLLFYLLTLAVCSFVCFRLFISSPAMAAISPLARGLFLLLFMLSTDPRWALHNFNPVVLCTALLLYCCFDERSSGPWLPALCFAMAVLLKPQIALLFTLPLYVRPRSGRPMLLRAFALVLAVALPALLWCALHPQLRSWPADIHANLLLGAAHGNDMSPFERMDPQNPRLNLDYLFGYWTTNPRLDEFFSATVFLASLAFLLVALAKIKASFSSSRYKLAVAFTAALTLMPTYHRAYDALILVAALPWLFEAIITHRHRTAAWLALIAFMVNWVVWESYLPDSVLGLTGVEQPPSAWLFLTHRFHALLTLALLLLFCWLLLQQMRPAPAPQQEPA